MDSFHWWTLLHNVIASRKNNVMNTSELISWLLKKNLSASWILYSEHKIRGRLVHVQISWSNLNLLHCFHHSSPLTSHVTLPASLIDSSLPSFFLFFLLLILAFLSLSSFFYECNSFFSSSQQHIPLFCIVWYLVLSSKFKAVLPLEVWSTYLVNIGCSLNKIVWKFLVKSVKIINSLYSEFYFYFYLSLKDPSYFLNF